METRALITCKELIDFIGAFLDDELPSDQRAEFERHLAVCPSCQAYLKTYGQTVELAKAGGDVIPADVPEALLRSILLATGRVPPARAD